MNTKEVAKLIGKTERETLRLAHYGVLGASTDIGWKGDSRISITSYSANKVANYLGISTKELKERLDGIRNEGRNR